MMATFVDRPINLNTHEDPAGAKFFLKSTKMTFVRQFYEFFKLAQKLQFCWALIICISSLPLT